MQFSKIDYSYTPLKQYTVYGCRYNTKSKQLEQPVFKSTVFANNEVFARSSFTKLLQKRHKIKRSECVVAKIEEVPQDTDFELKNYGLYFQYMTKNGLQNGYKEVRHINCVLAVSDLYRDFGSRHKLKASAISVYKIVVLKDDEVKKARILAYTGDNVEFPVFKKVPNTDREFVPCNQEIFN